jgi:hypothetical protein
MKPKAKVSGCSAILGGSKLRGDATSLAYYTMSDRDSN